MSWIAATPTSRACSVGSSWLCLSGNWRLMSRYAIDTYLTVDTYFAVDTYLVVDTYLTADAYLTVDIYLTQHEICIALFTATDVSDMSSEFGIAGLGGCWFYLSSLPTFRSHVKLPRNSDGSLIFHYFSLSSVTTWPNETSLVLVAAWLQQDLPFWGDDMGIGESSHFSKNHHNLMQLFLRKYHQLLPLASLEKWTRH